MVPLSASSFADRLDSTRRLRRMLAVLATLSLTAGSFGALAQVTVETKPLQTMTYGMDFERLSYWDGVSNKDEVARLAVVDCKVDYVRVAIVCGAEEREGEFKWELYKPVLEMMSAFKKANPNIKFFASQQPLHVSTSEKVYTCYPLWVISYPPDPQQGGKQEFKEFKPDKAADYLTRYLTFMKEHGFRLDYMDIKNEVRHIRPDAAAKMIALLRKRIPAAEMPKIVAPSSHNYKDGTDWLDEAIETGNTNFFDIAATHNTRITGSLTDFAARATTAGKPVWITELHQWRGPDDLAVSNQMSLFTHIRAGASGINDWLTLGNEKKDHKMLRGVEGKVVPMRTYYIYKKLVNTSGGGNYLASNVPEGLASTVAFRKGDTMTVWLLNADDRAVDAMTVRIRGQAIADSKIRRTWWGPENGREGTEDALAPASADTFTARLNPKSLSCFEFKVRVP